MAYRVLLADDHRIVLDGLYSILQKQPDMDVVGLLNNGRDVLEKAHEVAPDVVVLDISMHGMNGIETARRLKAGNPNIEVLCLSMHSDVGYVSAMLQAGASGYLLKEDAAEMLVAAIHTVMSGKSFLSPGVAGSVVELIRGGTLDKGSPFSLLSGREREVLQLIAEGHSTREISALLSISERTVGSHRENLKGKLGIASVAGLTRYALQYGLTPLESR